MTQPETEARPEPAEDGPAKVPRWAQPLVGRISQLNMELVRCRLIGSTPKEVDLLETELEQLRRTADTILCRYDGSFVRRLFYRQRRRMASVERRLRVLELNLLYVLPESALIARVPGMRAKLKRHIRTTDPRYDLYTRMLDAIAAQTGTASDELTPSPAAAQTSRQFQL